MRTIKFRGKRVDDGEWMYGSLLDGDIIVSGPVDVDEEYIGLSEWHSVDPETVGQYTGLRDKNGKEVYEGDVVKDHSGIGEIEWVQEHSSFRVFAKDPDFGNMYLALESDGQLKNTEVIGNIYANPDLLANQT